MYHYLEKLLKDHPGFTLTLTLISGERVKGFAVEGLRTDCLIGTSPSVPQPVTDSQRAARKQLLIRWDAIATVQLDEE